MKQRVVVEHTPDERIARIDEFHLEKWTAGTRGLLDARLNLHMQPIRLRRLIRDLPQLRDRDQIEIAGEGVFHARSMAVEHINRQERSRYITGVAISFHGPCLRTMS